jgi:hypothetical protein
MGMIEEGTYKDNSDQNPSRRRSWLQMRLASLIMLLTVAAIWVQWVSMQRQIRWLEQEIPQLQQLATNLVPIDPGLCYLFKTPGSYEEESSWQIHLPKGQKRTLTLGGQWKNLDRFPKDCNDATALLLGEGMHRIEVKRIGFESGIQWIVRLNGQEVFEKKIEAKDGGPGWIGYEPDLQVPLSLGERDARRFFHREIKDPNPVVTTVPSQITTADSPDAQGIIMLLSEAI